MKIFIAANNTAVKLSLEKALSVLTSARPVASVAEADVVLVDNRTDLVRLHVPDKEFVFMYVSEVEKNKVARLPNNTVTIHVTEIVAGLVSLETKIAHKPAVAKSEIAKPALPSDHKRQSRRFKILVVDDKDENRELARTLLGEDHELTVCANYGNAVSAITAEKFDVVLTDSQLPIGVGQSGALNLAHVTPGEVQHQGIYIALLATLNGAHAAVVTDANHHQDWVSAILDGFRNRPMIANNRRLLLINYMGKRWDKALHALVGDE